MMSYAFRVRKFLFLGGYNLAVMKSQEGVSVRLTKRELEVLFLVVEGKTNKDVGDTLYVSKRTAEFHLANIYDKLQVSNRVQALRRAARLGLIPLEATLAEA